jgi:type IV secretory pathway VirB3-like protein
MKRKLLSETRVWFSTLGSLFGGLSFYFLSSSKPLLSILCLVLFLVFYILLAAALEYLYGNE